MGRQEQGVRSEESLTYAPALAKLKLEADKIRKWKTATQFELKKKVTMTPTAQYHMIACVGESVV